MRPIQDATEVFSYKWHSVILYTVYELDGAGYSELDAALDDISSKMLSGGLSDLCERDILAAAETVEGSGRTVYQLTAKGRALVSALEVLDAWHQRFGVDRSSILILEDERMVADLLAEYFPDTYDVQHVRTGEEAIEQYTDDVDLIVVDRNLDDISGDEVATRIRAEHEQPLVLCVSGIEPDDEISGLAYDDYIHKPVEEREVRTRLELLLNRAGLDPTEREYLSLRSKQIALTHAHGRAATKMEGYRECTARIGDLELPPDRKETLEPLLPSGADSTGE
jgi:DNA-binding response OmpR family regulator/DNA-binding HxlR family transcriptional regulator